MVTPAGRAGHRSAPLAWAALLAIAVVALVACVPDPPAPPEPPPLPCPLSVEGGAGPATAPGEAVGAPAAIPGEWFAVVEDASGSARVVGFEARTEGERDRRLAWLTGAGERVVSVEQDSTVVALDVTDPVYRGVAPYWGGQYGVDRAGFPAAWTTTTGTGARVAVVDTGVDADHPDLGRWETGGAVVAGADFIVASGDGRTDPNTHGTHVAGIAAARVNALGGVGGAPTATIVPVRVLGASGAGTMSTVVQGILWASDPAHGDADVINLSLGGGTSAGLRSALLTAVGRGATIVVAAGNSGCSSQALYPAAYAPELGGVLAVAATDAADAHSSFSSIASYVSISGPGTSIWSSVPGATWALKSGTSMATPFVSAAAALLRASCPALTPPQIEQRLEETAQDLGPGPGTSLSPPIPASHYFGTGLVRADRAVAGAC